MKIGKSSLARGVLVTIIGSGTSKLLMILATFLCARLLTQADFGSFSFLRNSLNMVLVLSALNYTGLVTKFTTELQYKKEGLYKLVLLFVFTLLVCAIGSVFLYCFPQVLLGRLSESEEIIPYVRWIGLLLPLFILQPLFEGILRGQKRFVQIGKLQIVSSVLFIVLVVLGIKYFGLDGALWALLIYLTSYSIISFLSLKHLNYKQMFGNLSQLYKGCVLQKGIILKMVVPVFLLSFIDAPINWWAQVLMAERDSLSVIGSMTIILQIRNIILLIPTYYFSTFTSYTSSLYASGDYLGYFQMFGKSFKMFLVLSLLGWLVISMGNQFCLGIFGEIYKQDSVPFLMAMVSIPFLVLSGLLKVHLLIFERQRQIFWISIVSSTLFILSLYLFMYWGISSINAYFLSQFVQVSVVFIFCSIYFLQDKRISYVQK